MTCKAPLFEALFFCLFFHSCQGIAQVSFSQNSDVDQNTFRRHHLTTTIDR